MRVLIVDDDALLRRLLRVWLEAQGVEVEEAEDGGQALERLVVPGPPPDVVMLDAMMPGVGGLEVLRRLRAAGTARPPILMLTASRHEADIQACLALGADDFLAKPLQLDTLDALVGRLRRLAGRSEEG